VRESPLPDGYLNMAKKKVVNDYLAGYVPANFTPLVTTEQIKQIPPYPDPGVKFAGYAKVLSSNGNYDLKKQQTQHTTAYYSNTASGVQPSIFDVPAGKTFYMTGICSQHSAVTTVPTAFLLIDGAATLPNARMRVQIGNQVNEQYIDFSGSPRPFNTSIIPYFDAALGLTQYVAFDLFGWIEDN